MPVRLKRCSGPCGDSYPITHFWSDAGAADGRMSRCPECEKTARKERAEAKANGQLEGGKPDRNGRVVVFTEEERKRRSELAKRLHAEGRFGGAVIGTRGGQAISRHRLTDSVLEHFRQPDQQELIKRAYEKALKGKNKQLALTAAEKLLIRDEKAAERERADRGGAVDPASMTQEELEAFVAQGIQAKIDRGELPVDIELGADAVHEVD
jgi:hypothetical protein